MSNSNQLTKGAHITEDEQLGKERNVQPATVPGLFRFEPHFLGGYTANMEPALLQRYEELRSTYKPLALDLAWALDMVSKIRYQDLDYLVLKNGYMMLKLPDDECEAEYGERIDPDSRSHQISVMARCCDIVLTLQQAIGTGVSGLVDKKSNSRQRDVILKSHSKLFHSALECLHRPQRIHEGGVYINVKHPNGLIEKVSIYLRAIQVALELATSLQQSPTKAELREALKKEDKQLRKKKPKNFWTKVYRKAGLSGLPPLRPWSLERLQKGRLEDLK
jgi:hypothetical protein